MGTIQIQVDAWNRYIAIVKTVIYITIANHGRKTPSVKPLIMLLTRNYCAFVYLQYQAMSCNFYHFLFITILVLLSNFS